MARIRVVGQRSEQGRCAYCLDSVEETVAPCAGCGARVHPECGKELGGCPSLGCAQAPKVSVRARRTERAAQHAPPRQWTAGRARRENPSLLARVGPYGRIVVRTALAVVTLLGSVGVLGGALYNAGDLLQALASGKDPLGMLVAGIGLFAMLSFLSYIALDWLGRLPAFVGQLQHLLDDGVVTPTEFEAYSTGSGKKKKLWVKLRPTDGSGPPRTIQITGILPPWWLSWRSRQEVYVHGTLEEGQPLVIEFENGMLALIDP